MSNEIHARSTRCRILRSSAKHVKPNIRPLVKPQHKNSRLEWAKKYLKVDFQPVLFTAESRVPSMVLRWSKGHEVDEEEYNWIVDDDGTMLRTTFGGPTGGL